MPGESLPPVRRLAIDLGVHFNTVAEAYRLLAAEGWLELQHGRSAVVLERVSPTVAPEAWVNQFRDRLQGLIAQMRADGVASEDIAAELRTAAKAVTRS